MHSVARRLTVIAALYVSQAIPLGFFIIAVPAILRRRGLPLEQVGLLGALALPWLLKFAWAPLVDRYGARRLGHYRSWIVPLQMASVVSVLLLSAVELERGLTALIVAGAVFMFCSASQDIATDGLAVRTMAAAERGAANGVQVGGYYLGQILGGGLVLVLFDRFGWRPAVITMAILLALPLLPLVGFRENPGPVRSAASVDFAALRRFFGRRAAWSWIAVLLLFRAGDTMALTMFNPLLVDRGFTAEQIGMLLGVAGSAAALGGALLGGMLTGPLGRKPSLIVFGTLQVLALLGYQLPATGVGGAAVIYAVALLAAFAGGMATAALYTNMMDRSDPARAATDFTLQQSLCAVGPLVGSSLSGFVAGAWGYPVHFAVCALVAGLAVVVVARWLTAAAAAPLPHAA